MAPRYRCPIRLRTRTPIRNTTQQKPDLGFPLARIAAIFSLSCGAIIDLGICRYAGKGQGEISLFRTLWDFFQPGDVVLTDRLYCTWRELLTLQHAESIQSLNCRRCARPTFERENVWAKTITSSAGRGRRFVRSAGGSKTAARISHGSRMSNSHRASGLSHQIHCCGNDAAGCRGVHERRLADLSSTLECEFDLCSVKQTLQMDILRCKTPELVRKEIWTHILAYNLIRTIMAQAATKHEIQPRTISFKGSLQFLEEFQRLIDYQEHRGRAHRMMLYEQLLDSIASQRVADRPDRFEPRLLKRRPKHFAFLRKPRHVIKSEMTKGVR